MREAVALANLVIVCYTGFDGVRYSLYPVQISLQQLAIATGITAADGSLFNQATNSAAFEL